MNKPLVTRVIRLTVVLCALGYWAVQQGYVAKLWHPAKTAQHAVAPEPNLPPVTLSRRVGSLELTACELGPQAHPLYASLQAYCADVPVPENWQQPNGRLISIHIAWLPAHTSQPLADPVVFLDGGPGGAATEDFPGLAGGFAGLMNERSILLMDQRGTGRSHPLHCAFDADDDPASLKQRISKCVDSLKPNTDLAMYTTTATIHDLDAIRNQLGIAQLNLFGISYGTRVAQQYAEQFAAHTRSIILDSPVPNALALGQDHALNLDAALQQTFDRCHADPACDQRFTDNYQRLMRLKAQLNTPKQLTIPDPWDQHPQTVTLTQAGFATTVRMLAYSNATAALLPLMLHNAEHGQWQSLATAQLLVEHGLAPIGRNNVLELSIICSEDAQQLHADDRNQHTLLGTRMVDSFNGICPLWPRQAASATFHRPLQSDIPTLILAGSDDPVTPPRYGDEIAKSLSHSKLLTFQGMGHGQIMSVCAPPIIKQFIQTTQFNELPVACLNRLTPTAAFWSNNGPKA
jgi:pimeloyl-ACP methyl ester carboxylesterase